MSLEKYQRIGTIFTALLLSSAFLGVGISFREFYLFHFFLVLSCGYALSGLFYSKVRIWFLARISTFAKTSTAIIWILIFLSYFVHALFLTNFIQGIKWSLFPLFGLLTLALGAIFIDTSEKFKTVIKFLLFTFLAHVFMAFFEISGIYRHPISPISPFAHFFGRMQDPDAAHFLETHAYLSTPTTFFWNPNDMALVTLVGFFFFYNLKSLWIKILSVICTSIIMVFSSSRSMFALSLFVLGGHICCDLLKGIHFKWSKKSIAAVTILPFLFCFFLFGVFKVIPTDKSQEMRTSFASLERYVFAAPRVFIHAVVVGRKMEDADLPQIGEVERILFMEKVLLLIRENPLVGIGGGELSRYHLDSAGNHNPITSPHVYWLQIAAEVGLPVLVLYIFWYFSMGVKLFKREGYLPRACLLALVFFFPACLVMQSAIYFLPKWVLYFLADRLVHLEQPRCD